MYNKIRSTSYSNTSPAPECIELVCHEQEATLVRRRSAICKLCTNELQKARNKAVRQFSTLRAKDGVKKQKVEELQRAKDRAMKQTAYVRFLLKLAANAKAEDGRAEDRKGE